MRIEIMLNSRYGVFPHMAFLKGPYGINVWVNLSDSLWLDERIRDASKRRA